MQPQGHLQQPPAVIMVTPAQVNSNGYEPKALHQMRILSIIQIVIGALCTILGLSLLILGQIGFRFMGLEFTGYGMIVGVYFAVVGSIGLLAVHFNTGGKITAAMVLNIVSSSLFDCFLGYCSLGGVFVYRCHGDEYHKPACDMLALTAILLLLTVAEFVVALWSAILCCKAVCRCCKPHSDVLHMSDHQPRLEMCPDAQAHAPLGQVFSGALSQPANPDGLSDYPEEPLEEPNWQTLRDTSNLV